jgi:prephenate dehydratase
MFIEVCEKSNSFLCYFVYALTILFKLKTCKMPATKQTPVLKVAYFGHPGSYSHLATLELVKKNIRGTEPLLIPCTTIKEVFQYLGPTDFLGVAPYKNNIAGPVPEFKDALGDKRYHVVDDIDLPISHTLLAHPEADLLRISQIVSHPHALKQCSQYLHTHYPHAKLVSYSNTSTAARDLSEGTIGKDSLVVASSIAAHLYNLHTVATNIQDSANNYTSFRLLKG